MRLLMLGLILAIGCGKAIPPAVPSGKPAETAIKVRAAELWRAYQENELKAESLYKGKRVQIADLVASGHGVQRDQAGKYYVALSVGSSVEQGQIPGVKCYIDEEANSQFADVKGESKVTITGTVIGTSKDSRAYKGTAVIVEKCTLE